MTNPAGQGRTYIVEDGAVTGAFDVVWDDSLRLVDGVANLRSSLLEAAALGPGLHAWGEWTNTATVRPLDEL